MSDRVGTQTDDLIASYLPIGRLRPMSFLLSETLLCLTVIENPAMTNSGHSIEDHSCSFGDSRRRLQDYAIPRMSVDTTSTERIEADRLINYSAVYMTRSENHMGKQPTASCRIYDMYRLNNVLQKMETNRHCRSHACAICSLEKLGYQAVSCSYQ